jgi:VanZ family protein
MLILWMAVIFALSHQTGEQSGDLSRGVSEVIIEVVEKVAPSVEIDRRSFHSVMRKNAHFAAFFVLGILSAKTFSHGKQGRNGAFILRAITLCIGYAVFDEVHQLFVDGRGGQIFDVAIDSAGSACGIWSFWLFSRFFGKRSAVRDA